MVLKKKKVAAKPKAIKKKMKPAAKVKPKAKAKPKAKPKAAAKKKKVAAEPASLRVITPPFVIAFPSLFKSKTNDAGKEEYSCTMYFDKDDSDMSKIEAAIDQVITDSFKGKKAGIRLPIRDGDDESDNYSTYEGTENCHILQAKSVFKPGAVDADLEDVIDPGMIYSGAICRASLTAFSYEVNGNKGVSFSLNNVKFVADGDPLTGAGVKAADEFSEVEEAEYDEPTDEEPEEEDEEEGLSEEEEEESNEEDEEELEVYENEDGIMVYLNDDGEEEEYNEEDWE